MVNIASQFPGNSSKRKNGAMKGEKMDAGKKAAPKVMPKMKKKARKSAKKMSDDMAGDMAFGSR